MDLLNPSSLEMMMIKAQQVEVKDWRRGYLRETDKGRGEEQGVVRRV